MESVCILGFHVTWRRPCWCTDQQRKKSLGKLILLLCKTSATFCHFFVHQHGPLIARVKTKNTCHYPTSNCFFLWNLVAMDFTRSHFLEITSQSVSQIITLDRTVRHFEFESVELWRVIQRLTVYVMVIVILVDSCRKMAILRFLCRANLENNPPSAPIKEPSGEVWRVCPRQNPKMCI